MKMTMDQLGEIMMRENRHRVKGISKRRETDMGFNLPILEINGKHITLQCGCWDCYMRRKDNKRKQIGSRH